MRVRFRAPPRVCTVPSKLNLSSTRVASMVLSIGVLLISGACGPAHVGPEEQAPAPQSEFNLEGTWKWYDRFELPTGCLVQIWVEGDGWDGWIVQDFGDIQQCTRVDYRLDRVDLDGTRVSLWFRLPEAQRLTRIELRLEFVTPLRLRARSSNTPYFLVRVSG